MQSYCYARRFGNNLVEVKYSLIEGKALYDVKGYGSDGVYCVEQDSDYVSYLIGSEVEFQKNIGRVLQQLAQALVLQGMKKDATKLRRLVKLLNFAQK